MDQYDLIVLGMQEPQYANAEVKALMEKIAIARESYQTRLKHIPYGVISKTTPQ